MLKTVFTRLSIALSLLVAPGFFEDAVSLGISKNHPAFSADVIPVEVTFDGLMVFRKVGDHYEVGVLDGTAAPHHRFDIISESGVTTERLRDKELRALIAKGGTWSLRVESASGVKAPDIRPREVRPCNRSLDTANGQVDLDHMFDFCWIMDLETDFHPQGLELIPEKLKPIIQLNNGELYAKYKYDELQRFKGKGTPFDYGFVTETVAIRIDLRAGEDLVLRGPSNEVVLRLKPRGLARLSFFNAPVTAYKAATRRSAGMALQQDSHFKLYYNLFRVDQKEQFDIKVKPSGRRPLNRFDPHVKAFAPEDKLRIFTFDNQACGAAFLGKSSGRLQ